MMRTGRGWTVLLAVVLVVAGCQTSSGPDRREILGSWVSDSLAGVGLRMTLAETVRSIDGAGTWNDAEVARAFRVSGALAVDEVALYLDFEDRADLSFIGFFSDDDVIQGELSGGELDRVPIELVREDRVD